MASPTLLKRPVLRPVSTLRQQVIESLRGCITDLTFKPGDRLIERELCEMLGVSRTLVREALSQLMAEGIIQTIPHKGPIVTVLDAKDAKGLYEVRAQLEALAAKRFALHATAAQRAELQLALRHLVDHGDADPTLHFLQAKGRFYDVLLTGGDNAVLAEMLKLVHTRVTLLRATTLSQPGRLKTSYKEIEAIVKAACAGDGEKAALAAQLHVRQAEQLAARLLGGTDAELVLTAV